MDVRTHKDVAAAAAARSELGHEYDDALAVGLIERISSEIGKQVDARLAQHGIQSALQPSWAAWANAAIGLGSVPAPRGNTAFLSVTGTVPKAVVNLGPFHVSVMSSTTSISTAQVVLVVLIWVVIAVVNIADGTPAAVQVLRVLRCERRTSPTVNAGCRMPGQWASTLCSCRRRDAHRGGRNRSRQLPRMPSRTVAARLICGARVAAAMRGSRLPCGS